MPTVLPLLALLAFSAQSQKPATSPSPATQETTYSLAYKPVVDEVLVYDVAIEGKISDMRLETSVTSTQKVLSIDKNGGYTVETKTKGGETKFNGEVQGEAGEEKTSKSVYDVRGHEVLEEPDEKGGDPVSNLFSLAGDYTSKEGMKIGDTFTAVKHREAQGDPLVYKVDRIEKLNDEDVIVLVGTGKGPKGETIESTHWISTDRFIPRKSVMKFTGIDFGGATGDLTATVTLHKAS